LEIDAKGVLESGEDFVVVECRRYNRSRLGGKEDLAAIEEGLRQVLVL
jgi:hypothetical protein